VFPGLVGVVMCTDCESLLYPINHFSIDTTQISFLPSFFGKYLCMFICTFFYRAETIIETRGWPFRVPSPIESVEKALKDFKEALDVNRDNSADLLMDIMHRSDAIRQVQHQLAKKRQQQKHEAHYTAAISDAMKELDDIHEIVFDQDSGDHSESDPLIGASSVV
jgi:hypothetical protein